LFAKIAKISFELAESTIITLIKNTQDMQFVRTVIISNLDEELITYPYLYYFSAMAKIFSTTLQPNY
jgi:hypothetical protein